MTLQARSERDLEGLKTGDRAVVQYFEGTEIRTTNTGEAVPVLSPNGGLIDINGGKASGKNRTLIASVEAIDIADQEITLKGPDGSLETIMVTNPGYLKNTQIDDKIAITRVQALALSLAKED